MWGDLLDPLALLDGGWIDYASGLSDPQKGSRSTGRPGTCDHQQTDRKENAMIKLIDGTRQTRLLYRCAGLTWASVGLGWVATWDGQPVSSAVGSTVMAVGSVVMAAAALTVGVCWIAWNRRTWKRRN